MLAKVLWGIFIRNIFVVSNYYTGCILFIFSYVVALMRNTSDGSYFLFDLHCRNICKITDRPYGLPLLSNFACLNDVERCIGCIEEIHEIANREYPPYFQVQFLSVDINCTDHLDIQNFAEQSF